MSSALYSLQYITKLFRIQAQNDISFFFKPEMVFNYELNSNGSGCFFSITIFPIANKGGGLDSVGQLPK